MQFLLYFIYLNSSAFFNRIHTNLLLGFAFSFELNIAVYDAEQSIVAADHDIMTGVNFGPPLPDQYIPGSNELAVASFYSEALGFTVSTVSSAANTLLMCHF